MPGCGKPPATPSCPIVPIRFRQMMVGSRSFSAMSSRLHLRCGVELELEFGEAVQLDAAADDLFQPSFERAGDARLGLLEVLADGTNCDAEAV